MPGVTALLDYLFLGNRLAALSMAGMAAIVLGLLLVFSETASGRDSAQARAR